MIKIDNKTGNASMFRNQNDISRAIFYIKIIKKIYSQKKGLKVGSLTNLIYLTRNVLPLNKDQTAKQNLSKLNRGTLFVFFTK